MRVRGERGRTGSTKSRGMPRAGEHDAWCAPVETPLAKVQWAEEVRRSLCLEEVPLAGQRRRSAESSAAATSGEASGSGVFRIDSGGQRSRTQRRCVSRLTDAAVASRCVTTIDAARKRGFTSVRSRYLLYLGQGEVCHIVGVYSSGGDCKLCLDNARKDRTNDLFHTPPPLLLPETPPR